MVTIRNFTGIKFIKALLAQNYEIEQLYLSNSQISDIESIIGA